MSPVLRKATLNAHVTSSVGWPGAVAVFLALAIVGGTSAIVGLVVFCALLLPARKQQAATFTALASLAGHAPSTGNGNGSPPRSRRPSGGSRVRTPGVRKTTKSARTATEIQPPAPPVGRSAPLAMSVRIELNLPISEN